MITKPEISKKINDLRLLQTHCINNFQYSKTAKIPFKVHSFIEIMNCRMLDFSESTEILIYGNHLVPAMTLIRSLFENVAVLFQVVTAMDHSLKSHKIVDNFDGNLTSLTFGTRYDNEIKAVNIITQIDKLEKEYVGIKSLYDNLCEFVHPNWDGVQGSYSELNEKSGNTGIFKVITVSHPLNKWIEQCFLLAINMFLDFSQRAKKSLIDFTLLCESEI